MVRTRKTPARAARALAVAVSMAIACAFVPASPAGAAAAGASPGVAGPQAGCTTGPHGPGRPAVSISVKQDQAFRSMFRTYGNDNTLTDDWTGADGTSSVRLPDGRTVWAFSDTFLGTVKPDGSRPTSTPLINNDIVVQAAGGTPVQTLHGGTASRPKALVVPSDGDSWYWVEAGTAEAGELRVFVSEYTRTGPGPWDWIWSGTAVASFALPDLTLLGTTAVPSANGVTWGTAVLDGPSYTYVYGVEDLQATKWLHLARVPLGDVLGAWQYWTGSGWSADPAASIRMLKGVDNGFGVVLNGTTYELITMDTSVPFSKEMVAYFACSPEGPWGSRTHVYDTPESGRLGGNLFAYGALAHPEFADSGGLLMSYDVNTFAGAQSYQSVYVYRPRFLRVKISFTEARVR